MKSPWLKAAIVLGLVALATIGFFHFFERVPVKEYVGASGEARVRQFLAAERFAERMGLRARELRSLPELDRIAPGVLLMPNRRQALDAARIARIVAWVQAGGHLIAEAEFLGVDDPLFERLGVQRTQAEGPSKPQSVALPDGRTLTVAFPERMALRTPPALELRLRAGDKLMSYAAGRGAVTVASSLHFARNGLIGRNDHAAFLWTLLELTPAPELQVYFRPERLSLAGFLAEHAAPALAAAGLLLALWLWRIAPRFGPVAPDLPPARRRLLDHLRASGRYYWAQGLRARLVVAARDAALRRIVRSQPDFAGASASEKGRRVAALVGARPEEAGRFIAAGGAMRGADFIRLVQRAQHVHSALERGGK